MKFTYQGYTELIDQLKRNDYKIVTYLDESSAKKQVILRHDIDNSLEKAVEFAKLEKELKIHSTYYILLTSDFYNIASRTSKFMIHKIKEYGHDIGLHFDETAYEKCSGKVLIKTVEKEVELVKNILNIEIQSVSMHRPSQYTLECNYVFSGLINSYSKKYFNMYKYLSDSRMYWREDVNQIINEGHYKKLHILTHPFWYYKNERTMKDCIKLFINQASISRYDSFEDNFRELGTVLSRKEIGV